MGSVVVALAAAWCLTLALPRAWRADAFLHPHPSFQARGSASRRPAGVEIYRAGPNQALEPAAGSIRAHDELAFAYTNAASYPFLAVFGIDDRGRVYWYHPAWTDPTGDPESIPIQGGAQIRELPEAVSHTIDGTELRIVSVFTQRPLHVREMERRIDQARRRGLVLAPVLGNDFGEAMVFEHTLKVIE
jgi:hypothetical protein